MSDEEVEETVKKYESALLAAFIAVSKIDPSTYVQSWPSGLVSIELDAVPIKTLARAVIASLRSENVIAGRS